MKRDQELINIIRKEIMLPNEITDDEIWEKTKDTFTAQRIALGMAQSELRKAIIDLVKSMKLFEPLFKPYSSKLKELDSDAKANLSDSDLGRYFEYKKELIRIGESMEDQESILRGFIWDCIESYDED